MNEANKHKSFVFVMRELHPNELALIKQQIDDLTLVVLNVPRTRDFDGLDVFVVPESKKMEVDNALFERIKLLGHARFFDDKNVIDLLQYNGKFSPWFAIKSPLYSACLQPHWEYHVINEYLNKANYEKLFVFGACPNGEHLGLNSEYFSSSQAKPKTSKLESLKYVLVFLIRGLFGFVHRLKSRQAWMLHSNLVRQKMWSSNGEWMEDGDPVLHYLSDAISKTSRYQNILMLKNPGAFKLPRLKHSLFPYANVLRYSYFETQLMGIKGLRGFVKARSYKNRIVYNLFKAQENANGFDSFILARLRKYASSLMLSALRYEVADALIKRRQPMLVSGDDEYTLLKFPFFQAARHNAIPTYAFQHGGISLKNINYSFVNDDLKYCPIPDKTMVWGEYTAKQLITNSAFNAADLSITGQLRTDIIPVLKRRFDERNVQEEKTIVFASQPMWHLAEVRNKMFRDFIKLHHAQPKCNLIWKPHPNEKHDIKNVLKTASDSGVELQLYEGDLYELLAKAHGLITCYSTVGLEALYFDLELLILDYDRMDVSGYIREGVGHWCSSYEALEAAVSEVALNRTLTDAKKKKDYVAKRAFRIDGKVHDRMLSIMNQSFDGQ